MKKSKHHVKTKVALRIYSSRYNDARVREFFFDLRRYGFFLLLERFPVECVSLGVGQQVL